MAAGTVTLFEFNGSHFTETDQLWLSEPQVFSAFGAAVSLEGDSLIVGAPFYSQLPVVNMLPGGVMFYDFPRGSTVCSGEPNMTGAPARITVKGSPTASIGDVYVLGDGLPPGALCLGLIGSTTGFVLNPAGSRGNLCLAGELGRFVAQAGPASAAGQYDLDVLTQSLPLSSGVHALAAGDHWAFQLWYRDRLPNGTPTSNFSNAVSVTFD